MSIDPDQAWAAFTARDRGADGRFVGAVRTTGIYCKPSCPARHPRRENMSFFPDGVAARAAGFRACLRCKPDEVGRDRVAVDNALRLLDDDPALSLDALAARVGYAAHHFHRLFKRATGVTPAAWARGRRAAGAAMALQQENSVTDAIYAAGYSGPSRFYADAGDRLGMTPSAWRNGGRGVTIRWAIADTALGPMLLAATERGICRLSFDEDAGELARRFPHATVEPGGGALAELVEHAAAACADPARMAELPLDIAGTAFQQRVWAELRRIPPGQTRSYAALAAAAGNPRAIRAAGSACGANQVAVLIPCHRATRTNGSLGGYAYGLDRKRQLLDREKG